MEKELNKVSVGSNEAEDEREFWMKIIAEQMASGIRAAKFCEQRKLSFSKFHHWKYAKLRASSNIHKNAKPTKACQNQNVGKFIALEVSPCPTIIKEASYAINKRDDEMVCIVFKNGNKIIVPERIAITNLLQLVKEVGE